MTLSRGSCLRLLIASFACVTLPGCSKLQFVLFINRFHENIQVEINETAEKTRVPVDGYAFSEGGRWLAIDGIDVTAYTEKGKVVRKVAFSHGNDEDKYGDDFIVVEVGP